jgi:SAM-dependent methyltransferase
VSGARSDLFDPTKVFSDHFIHFGRAIYDDRRSDRETELIASLLGIRPGMAVLDLACGFGRIANRLASLGCEVTALDSSAILLDAARHEASEAGIDSVTYLHGDMREIAWESEFDRVVCWSTSFGYFSDDVNRQVLSGMHRALVPGGRMVIGHQNRDFVLTNYLSMLEQLPDEPSRIAFVSTVDDRTMTEHTTYDCRTGRCHTVRTVYAGGSVDQCDYTMRLFTFPELADWCARTGFVDIRGYGDAGEPLSLRSRRMYVTASR